MGRIPHVTGLVGIFACHGVYMRWFLCARALVKDETELHIHPTISNFANV